MNDEDDWSELHDRIHPASGRLLKAVPIQTVKRKMVKVTPEYDEDFVRLAVSLNEGTTQYIDHILLDELIMDSSHLKIDAENVYKMSYLVDEGTESCYCQGCHKSTLRMRFVCTGCKFDQIASDAKDYAIDNPSDEEVFENISVLNKGENHENK